MAIKMTKKIKMNGIDVQEFRIYPNTYIRIELVRGNKEMLDLLVRGYNEQELIDEKIYTFTPSVKDGSENFIAQGYEYLKTLPEFADAIDC